MSEVGRSGAPLAKRIGADSVAADVLQEEETAKETLARLDGIDVTTPEFTTEFEHFRQKVLAHAQHEEHEEHVRIRASTEPEMLESLGRRFALAEKTAPTRPHPNVPSSRGANLALGPILAVTDRVRDALRDAGGDERG